MQSKITISYNLDNSARAAEELLAGIDKNIAPSGHSVGILYVYSDADVQEIVAAVSARAHFPVIGCTSIACMESAGGLCEMGAMLVLLTAPDCEIALAQTKCITKENIAAEVESAYASVTSQLSAPPKLVFALPPYDLGIMLDEYTLLFNKLAPGVPFVGGLPSFHANGDINATFYNGSISCNQMVLLAITGNIRPVFSVQTVNARPNTQKLKITHAEKNTVYTVDDRRFTDFLTEYGLPIDTIESGNPTSFFVANPLLLENIPSEKSNNFSFMRTLHKVDLENGTGTAIGLVPQGATVSISELRRDDIEQAGRAGIEELLGKMQAEEKNGYTYTTVLAISCIGRFTIMIPKGSVEANSLRASLPKHILLAGFYGNGEIGPLPDNVGQAENFAHNESLVLCAF